MPTSSRRPSNIALSLGVALGALGILEVALPWLGLGPWVPYERLVELPSMSQPHPDLGWRNQPGVYRFDPSGQGAAPITITIREDGARGTRSSVCEGRQIWVMGGSFTYGFALDDGLDFPSVAAEQAEGLCVSNYGVPGYGTLQSIGLYDLLGNEGLPKPDVVVYGLVEYHDARNIGALSWLAALERGRGDNAWVKAPYARLVAGVPKGFAPVAYTHWPLSEASSLIYLLERVSIALMDWTTAEKTQLTIALMAQWNAKLQAEGRGFLVAILHAPTEGDAYLDGLKSRKVRALDLRSDGYPGEGYQVPGDGHPNGLANRQWGEALAEALEHTGEVR